MAFSVFESVSQKLVMKSVSMPKRLEIIPATNPISEKMRKNKESTIIPAVGNPSTTDEMNE
jgi:hypothetical protein